MIFLDNASTTMLCESAVENLVKYSTQTYFNPSSNYSVAYAVAKGIEDTKKLIAEKLGVEFSQNIIFTGSATEASNLAIMGSYRKHFKKMVFSVGEHPSVYQTAMNLKELGVEVLFVNLQKNGEVDYAELEKVLDENVSFISIMHVSNETGAINDIKRINLLRNKLCPNAILHCDGVQAFGKIPTNLGELGVDFYTISAHKLHGPKGLGALYVKNPRKLKPVMYGGGQEYALRSGTENVASIMAFKSALEEINISKSFEYVGMLNKAFKEKFLSLLKSEIQPKFVDNENLSPYIISVSVAGLKGEVLQHMCDSRGLMLSTGSACSSKKSGNRILENLKYNPSEVIGNLRISFSRYTSI
ncbi:MAG: cysteine desulfurase, partial [Clostridia bacterium]|nr:cysteine desulfurase [Clostridia bacterium]